MQKLLAPLLLLLSFSASAESGVLLYGDDSCEALRAKLEREIPLSLRNFASCGSAFPKAMPSAVILVVNSFRGIRPENRSHLAQLKAKGISRFAVVLANTHLVDDAELLELETLELIESMNGLGLPGDETPFFLDYEKAPYDPKIPIRKGIRQIARFVSVKK